jgi:hypothetical protein
MMARSLALTSILLLACNGETADTEPAKPTTTEAKPAEPSKPESKPAELKPAEPSKPAESKPAEPKPPELSEIFTNQVFRAKDGRALLRLPELPDGWELVHQSRGKVSGVMLFRGTKTDFTGFISVVVMAPLPSAQSAVDVLPQFTKMMRSGMEHLTASGDPQPFTQPAGLSSSLAGTSSTGVSEKAWLGVVVDGSNAVGVLVRAEASMFDAQLMPMAKTLLAGLSVGSKVPRLPENNPGTRLEGIWEHVSGLRVDWLIFDPRGWASFASPDDPTWTDLDLSFALQRTLWRYRVEADTLILDRVPQDDYPQRRWSLVREGDSLLIDEDKYQRIDGVPVKIAAGTWEYYNAIDTGNAYMGTTGIATDESTFLFNADGTYAFNSEFSYTHNEVTAGTPQWSAGGYAASAPAQGRWRIDGHSLILDDGKATAVRTVYASKHSPDQVVYIEGSKYVKMK